MSNIAIKVENLSKKYFIGESNESYKTLRDSVTKCFTSPFHHFTHSPNRQEIWALKDVSFEVKRGEVVGIIGRNGAGKTTLLKILSRITEPTKGYAEIRGRVGTLLEVGTGFHAELTGRENIYLNGAVLGMKKAEIERKFDEIVAFAEVEKFIDTPVKHYSDGMYVRLAFAVAAHLEPEILLVDEVLSVGDASFQHKCIGKIRNVAREGRTVLFVSHQMGSIKSLCSRAIQIHIGSIVQDGEPEEIINHYLANESFELAPERVWDNSERRAGNDQIKLNAIRVLNSAGKMQKVYGSSQQIIIEMEFELFHAHSALFVGFDLINQNGLILLRSCHNHGNEREWPKLKLGLNKLRCAIPQNILNNGIYFVAPRIGLNFINWIVFNEAEAGFEVLMDHSRSPFWDASHAMAFPGVISPCLSWHAVDVKASKEIAM
jgi:lipopolysaccharide transport system ATP-binding protein